MRLESSNAWAHRIVGALPPRWEKKLLTRYGQQRNAHAFGDHLGEVMAERSANIELREVVDRLAVVRIPLDASDTTICQAADALANRCFELASASMAGAERSQDTRGQWITGKSLDPMPLLGTPPLIRAALGRVAIGQGVTPPIDHPCNGAHVEDGPAIARMTDPQWWRRQLRRAHAKAVEGTAIRLGYVNKKRDPYISNESVMRRAQQNERNAAALDATIATNEDGQEYTLAELAATGPANKAIRRAELMTRIAGFERIADDLGHAGVFMTITAPSRMHKWSARNGGVFENPKYDGTLPNEAQKYHAKVWARIRASAARAGIFVYGFRIAEPNHDGTPHWHLLLFIEVGRVEQFRAIVARYALADSPGERGAAEHRVDFKPIDKGRGSAAGYIAKYVSKNIDGYRLDKDLIGNDAVETSHRVEAWASTWGIRQFQQIGGPPVGPWRELRRVKDMPAGAPEHLREAFQAATRTKAIDDLSDSQQQVIKGAQWDRYIKAQGGVFCGRDYRIKIAKAPVDGLGKYGEPLADRPIGVQTDVIDHYTPQWWATQCKDTIKRVTNWIVESARHIWTISKPARQLVSGLKAALPPWTRVNNCTRPLEQSRAADTETNREAVEIAEMQLQKINGWTGDNMQRATQ